MTDKYIKGSGGGGCFPAGVLVLTPTGEIPIEQIKVGDSVISFSPTGQLNEAKVSKVFVHEDEVVYTFDYWCGSLDVTPNHWVLNQYNAFVDIETLSVDDCLVDARGHLRPILAKRDKRYETVYNLSVEGDHTFIANGIRVHNGGKGTQKLVYGAGGGGGGGKGGGGGSSRQAIIDPDSLSSKQYARVLDLICEGEIEGLAEGAKSIFFDNTPLMASDGSYNFSTSGLVLDTRNGTQDQSPMSIFNTQEAEISTDNREITVSSPYVFTVTEPYVDKVRLNMVIPRLSSTDTTTGDVRGTSVSYSVQVKQDSTNPSSTFAPIISGRLSKANSTSLGPVDTQYTSVYTTEACDSCAINVSAILSFNPDRTYRSSESLGVSWVIEYKLASSGTWITSSLIGSASTTYVYTVPQYDYDSGVQTAPAAMNQTNSTGNGYFTINFPSYNVWDIRLKFVGSPWTISEPVVEYSNGLWWDPQNYSWGSRPIYRPTYLPYITGVTVNVYKYYTEISGKASNPYRFSEEVDISGMTFPVDIRIVRNTSDSVNQYLQNKTIIESYTKVLTEKLTYPNSALVGLQLDATQFSTIPSRTYDMKLLKVKVPNGYDPLTRTYPAFWDGTFVVAWTDNPAWVFYDLATNPRYGLGKYIAPETIDVFQLYNIAKHCDELVSDGYGGTEPRYTCNLYIQSREEAYKVLSNLASLFSSIVYWGIGSINILSDMESDVSAVFSNSNVVDSVFNYSTGSLKATHTVALVSYIDKTNSYKPAIEYVEDTSGVEKYGIKEIEVIAYGCTSRGQAHRLGRRILLTEKLEGEMLTFKTGLNAAYCKPGNIIKVVDNTIGAGNLTGGRLLNFSTSSVSLDRPITLKEGVSYSIACTFESNQVKIIPIINPANESGTGTSTVTVSTVTIKNSGDYFQAMVNQPVIGGIWALHSSEATNYSFWKVLGVKEADDLVFEVSCIKYDVTKFTQIETGIDLYTKLPPPGVPLEMPPIPTTIKNPLYTVGGSEPEYIDNVVITESLYRVGKADIATRLNVAWQAIPEASEYRVRYKIGINNWVTRTINVPFLEIDNAADGEEFTVELRAANIIGRVSNAITLNHTVVGKLAPPSDVTGLAVSRTLTTASLSWTTVTDLDLLGYEVRYYTGTATANWATSTVIASEISANRLDVPISGTAGRHNFLVKAIDTTGHYSTNFAQVYLTIDVPTTPTMTSTIVGGDVVLKVTPGVVGATQLPITNYDIVYGSSWETPTADVTEGLMDSNIIPVDYASRTYWVKVLDMAGNYSLSTSTTVNISVASAVTGMTSTFKNGKVYINWTPPTIGASQLPIVKYRIYKGNVATIASASYITDVSAAEYSQIVNWAIGSSEKFWVVPIDTRGNSYPGTAASLLVTTYAPQAVTFNASQQIGQSLLVDWNDADASLPIKEYEVRLNGTDWNTSTYLGVVTGSSIYIPLSSPGTLTIRVKATDVNNTVGTEGTTTYNYTVPAIVQNLAYTFSQDQARLSWTPPASISIPIDKYEVRYGSTSLGFTYGSTFSVRADWAGSRTFGVRAIDTAGNIGTETTINVTIVAPTAPSVSLAFNGADLEVSFTTPTSSLPIDRYEIRRGGTAWGVGDTLVDIITNNTLLYPVTYTGTDPMTYRVKAYDIVNTTPGAEGSNSIAVSLPVINSITAQAVDNNVLLYWSGTKGSLPIDTYEIRRGTAWATATVVGAKAGGFTTVFETVGGSYLYWVAAIDTAGNYSVPVSRAVTVTSPPDYVFRYQHNSQLNIVGNSYSPDGGTTNISITRNNCAIDPIDGAIIAPIYTAETWATHFNTRSWASIQAQIDAGYTIYAQPSNTTSADYIEEIDYGTTIGFMKVTVSYGGSLIAGTVNTNCYVSYKLNSGDAWSAEIPATEVFCSNFRYIKVRINMAATTQQGLYKLTSMSIKLDAKSKSDANSIVAVHSDANGTPVTWTNGVSFTDITSINTQAKMINIIGAITYSISGTTCTLTCTSHNLVVGDKAYFSFTGATPPAAGTYTVTSKTATTIVFTVASGSSTGTATVRVPLYALYDFTDVPNPTGFSVYLYDSAGNRCSGTVSWTAEGY